MSSLFMNFQARGTYKTIAIPIKPFVNNETFRTDNLFRTAGILRSMHLKTSF